MFLRGRCEDEKKIERRDAEEAEKNNLGFEISDSRFQIPSAHSLRSLRLCGENGIRELK
jgi:hypothetical protein